MTGAETAPPAAEPERLSGPELLRFFAGGLEALRSGAQAINSLNVFPVPDGDTGTGRCGGPRSAPAATSARWPPVSPTALSWEPGATAA